jgi:two-component system response regulator MtrA
VAKRVLVAEDEEDLHFLWRTVLERSGYEVVVAESGPDALAAARQTRPDAIILDGHLPGMSGAAVVAALASDDGLAHIPVVLMSGDPDAGRDLVRPPARSFMKPITPIELVRAIEELIGPGERA